MSSGGTTQTLLVGKKIVVKIKNYPIFPSSWVASANAPYEPPGETFTNIMSISYSQVELSIDLLPPANEVWGKVICLQVCVCP